MKRILSIADSIANTRYSAQRCVDTFSDYNVEPMLAVPEFTEGDSIEQTEDIADVLDYCLEQKLNAVQIGLIRDPEAVKIVASKLQQHDHPAVVAEPSVISPDGRILVSRDTYDAITGSLMQNIHFLVLNIFEAELFSGIECHGPADARQAAETICDKFSCVVFIGGCQKTGGRDLFAIGGKVKWYEGAASNTAKNKKMFAAAVACELAADKSINDAVTAARLFCGITIGIDEMTDTSVEYIPARPENTKSNYKPSSVQPAVQETAAKPVEKPVEAPVAKAEEKVEEKVPEQSLIKAVESVLEKPLESEKSASEEESSTVAPVSSLVSPAKSIRDAARSLEPMPSRIKFGSGISIPSNGVLARELAKSRSLTAVTSGIETPEPEDSKTSDPVINDMFERLRRLSEM